MTTAVELQSIVLDEQGRPIIAGTRFKVLLLAMGHDYWRLTAEQLHQAHPPLTQAQIYAALAYYYDHQAKLDAELVADDEAFDQLRQAQQTVPFMEKLRALGKIP